MFKLCQNIIFHCCKSRNVIKYEIPINIIENTNTQIYIDNEPIMIDKLFKNIKSGILISRNNNYFSDVYLYQNFIWKIYDYKSYYLENIKFISNKNIEGVLIPKRIIINKNIMLEKYNYYPNSDLFYILINNYLSKNDKNNIIYAIIQSVANLHNIGIAHRDIKLENILYFNKKVYLIDLVMCSQYNLKHKFYGGTYHYSSPELYQKDTSNIIDWRKNDIWSLGIVIYIILLNNFPWTNSIDCNFYTSYLDISNKKEYWNNLPIDKIYKKLLFKMLCIEPEEREDINILLNIAKPLIKV